METSPPSLASSSSATATLDEAVAFLIDCGFASDEPDPPSFDGSLCKFALEHSLERTTVLSSSKPDRCTPTTALSKEVRIGGSVSVANNSLDNGVLPVGFAVPSSNVAVPVNLKPRRRTAKDEIENLRRHVAILTIRRDNLKRKEERRTEIEDEENRNTVLNPVLMEQVVEQQLNSRKRSERENKRLRKLLQTQRRKSRQLLRVLRSNYMGAEVSSLAEVPADNSTVFEDLSSKLDEMILDVVRGTLSSTFPSEWSTSQEHSRVFFTDRRTKNMPFARHDVEQAVWDSMGKGGIQNSRNRFITGDYTAENTRTSSWRSTYSRDRLKLDVLIRKVARRFAAENCTIVVCRMLMQPTSYGSISLSGLQYLENRYVVIQNGQNGPLPDLGQTTTISCYLEVERQNTRAGVHPPGILKNYEIDAWTNLVAARAQILENLLLERATC